MADSWQSPWRHPRYDALFHPGCSEEKMSQWGNEKKGGDRDPMGPNFLTISLRSRRA